MADTERDIERARIDTGKGQALAADPAGSAWVSANAGTGKTHVLTMRVLRLMLAGTSPERILCLTYTKAAASEMSNRVFSTLAAWVTAKGEDLQDRLTRLLGRQPDEREMRQARQLFARAIETPGGLKVQTIHAFAERLLQRFPLEAGVPPNFTILDDAKQKELVREAVDDILREGVRNPRAPLGEALAKAVRFAMDEQFDAILREAIGEHAWIAFAARLGKDEDDSGETRFIAAETLLRGIAGVAPERDAAVIAADMLDVLDAQAIRQAIVALRAGSKRDQDHADKLDVIVRTTNAPQRTKLLIDFFMTRDGKPRADSQFATKAVREGNPAIVDRLIDARDAMAQLLEERNGIVLAEASVALLRLADGVLQRYAGAKQRRAALDYDDLIRHTVGLLGSNRDMGASSAQWVLYKLDGGLDHILVDEAQDTSPEQWRIVESLANEFFAGIGADENVRTIFAVGDEKQSIYRFQGAEPKNFALMGERFRAAAAAAGQSWARVPLTLSFRTVSAVLESVDGVFSDPGYTPGVGTDASPIEHLANRVGQAGVVEIWPPETPEESTPNDVWSPLDGAVSLPPAVRLARRIAQTIDGWLRDGEQLKSENRAITPGDILVLVRNRKPFASHVIQALKSLGIPVAGADRLRLTDQLAVRDLIVLGDFLILPEDDLALATVLKSPMFGLDDDDLMHIALGRKGTLWSSLLAHGARDARYQYAAETLKRWRSRSDFVPPFEFFASVLERDGMRRRFLARLGPDAADALDEFLNLALTYDEAEPPSLQGFVSWLAGSDHEVKRDMDHGTNQVRVMTVHGAKGLEAPIVFLPDTCRAKFRPRAGSVVRARMTGLPEDFAEPLLWPVGESKRVGVVMQSKAAAQSEEQEEYHRLLYVALTRARDRLYVAGFEGKNGRDKGCWYDIIERQLSPKLIEVVSQDGGKVLRYEVAQSAAHEVDRTEAIQQQADLALPDWARQRARAEATLSIPVAPSRLAPLEVDEIGDPIAIGPENGEPPEQRVHSPRALASDFRFQRGLVTHALLEHLPNVPADDRRAIAKAFVERRAAMLSAAARRGVVKEVLAILEAPHFGPVFGAHSRAEVPIVAEIPHPDGGAPLRILGEIDRLAVTPAGIFIIDYKTNRPPPAAVEGVARAYLMQLAAYRLAVSRIFDGLPVRAAILWTDGPRLMELPAEMLDGCAKELWLRGSPHLDGA